MFGPKFGYVDTSVISGLLGLPIILVYKNAFITKKWFTLWIIIAIMFCYSTIIYFLSDHSSNYLLLRQTRVLATTSLLPIVVYLFPLSANDKLVVLINVLLLNAIVIFMEIIFPQIQFYLAQVYMFDKGIKALRGFGLTAGYDTAGYLSVMGFILASLFILFHDRKFKYFFISLFFITSVFFTSRTSMLLIIAFVSVIAFYFIIFNKKKIRFIGICFAFFILFGVIYFLGIAADTFFFSSKKYFAFQSSINYTYSFANSNLADFITNEVFFPDNEYTLLFGGCIDTRSDLGYIKIIFMSGLFGLFLTLITHLFLIISANSTYKKILKFKKLSKTNSLFFDKNSFKIVYIALIIFTLLQLIINLKNLYFFTRGYYELLLILFFIFYSLTKQNRKRKIN